VSEIILEAQGLGKSYAGFRLEGISFRLERGSVMGLIGPNGAGKTTTIRLLMGLARPAEGRALLFGEEGARGPRMPRLLEKVGFVYEESRLYGTLSPRENGLFLSRVYSSWDRPGYERLLGDFGIDQRKPIDTLSKGQRTKAALAAALSHGAELLVLDEPTSGLDPVSRSEILDILYRFMSDGVRSVLFSTHITADLERIADFVTFLRSGRMVLSEPTQDALARHAVVKGPAAALAEIGGLLVGARGSDTGFVGLTDRAAELEGRPGLVLEKASLDDIIVYSTREDYRARIGA
jgi:ABC-2 type transport system ATP-binding protein